MMTKFTFANDRLSTSAGFSLPPKTIARAAQLSQLVPVLNRQWSVYRWALALFGLQQWLRDRAPDLHFSDDRCSLRHPGSASLIDAVCCVEVGEFSVCLIVTSNTDLPVAIPKAVLELPEFAAQFYVLVEVWEEEDWVRVCGGVWQERLVSQINSLQMAANPDWTYSAPATFFELDADDFLLELRCLDPIALGESIAAPELTISSSQLRSQLSESQPKLLAGDLEPWEILTWEAAKTLLCDAELVDELYLAPVVAIDRSSSSQSSGSQCNRLLDWLKGVVDDRWSLTGSFPQARIVFCTAEPTQNYRRDIVQLYASQPTKNNTQRSIPPNISDGDALADLIRAVDDEGIRRQAIELLQQVEPEHPLLSTAREQDLSLYIEGYSIAFRVMFIPRLDDRYSILLRLYATGAQRFLPEGLQLVVLDEAGNELVTHTAREYDDWIDRPLVVEKGDRFSIRIVFNESSVTEAFVV
jgi:Protein of unknown function (DUF1822)